MKSQRSTKGKRSTKASDNAWDRRSDAAFRARALSHTCSLAAEIALDEAARDHVLIDALRSRLQVMGAADMLNTFIGCIDAMVEDRPFGVDHITAMLEKAPRFERAKAMTSIASTVRKIIAYEIGLEIVAGLMRLGWRPGRAAFDLLQDIDGRFDRLSRHPDFDVVLAGLLENCPVPPESFNIAMATPQIGRADLGKAWLREASAAIATGSNHAETIYNLACNSAFISESRTVRKAATLAAWTEIKADTFFEQEVAAFPAEVAGLLSKSHHERMRALALTRTLADPALLP